MNLLSLFPELIWDLIFAYLDDPKDVLNTLEACKKLEDVFRSKKHLWLLGNVLPIIYKIYQLNHKDIMDCRLVCRKWQFAVDDLLQNNSFRNFPNFYIDTYNIQPGSIRFATSPDIYRFLDDVQTCSLEKGPFPSKSVEISSHKQYDEGGQVKALWYSVSELLANYGESINYIKFHNHFLYNDEGESTSLRFWRSTLNNLRWLPNLKCMKLSGNLDFNGERHSSIVPMYDMEYAALPNLEEIIVKLEPFAEYALPTHIIKNYASQLKSLSLNYWFEDLFDNVQFPNLSQFEVCDIYLNDWKSVNQFILSLENPESLSKVNLRFKDEGTPSSVCLEEYFISVLKRLPNIESFSVISEDKIPFRETNSSSTDPSLKIKFLQIQDSLGLNYEFLKCFPELKVLKIRTNSMPGVVDLSGQGLIREKIQSGKMFDCAGVWDVLKKLEKIILIIWYNIIDDRFVEPEDPKEFNFGRATYEYLKVNELLNKSNLELRKDISQFLEDVKLIIDINI